LKFFARINLPIKIVQTYMGNFVLAT